jgi:pilus assembly protein Flp/PilA
MSKLFRAFLRDEEGQDVVEYALLVAVIALVVAGFFPTMTGAIEDVFTAVETALGDATP